jgi:hypothetical protein
MDLHDPRLCSEDLLPVWKFLHRAVGVDDELLLSWRMSLPISLLPWSTASTSIEFGSGRDHCFLLPDQYVHFEFSTFKIATPFVPALTIVQTITV